MGPVLHEEQYKRREREWVYLLAQMAAIDGKNCQSETLLNKSQLTDRNHTKWQRTWKLSALRVFRSFGRCWDSGHPYIWSVTKLGLNAWASYVLGTISALSSFLIQKWVHLMKGRASTDLASVNRDTVSPTQGTVRYLSIEVWMFTVVNLQVTMSDTVKRCGMKQQTLLAAK